MAKRRNPKKEKALRNQAYARRFRKRLTQGRFGKKRFFRDSRPDDSKAEGDSMSPEETDDEMSRR